MDRDERLQACADWEAAAKLGSGRAVMAAKRNCGVDLTAQPVSNVGKIETDLNPTYQEDPAKDTAVLSNEEERPIIEKEKTNTLPPANEQANNIPTEVSEDQGGVNVPVSNVPDNVNSVPDSSTITKIDTVVVQREPEIDPRLLDDSENEIIIDEDLTLIVTGQGLGSRDLLRKPNILILSDEEGVVVIDVCVSRGGRIISTKYNEAESTLLRKSLVSLALRKSKDFWFDKSDLMEQCGKIIFQVKGI
jgi:hypothetical protein